MGRIRPFINSELIKVLIGIRRSGKSVMLELIQDELVGQGVGDSQFIRFNFEEMGNAHLCNAMALYEEIATRLSGMRGKGYIFLDEIQEVTDWERCINSLRVDFDCDIYITGSNAKLLSGELATYLAGRYVEFVIYPFSFTEFFELYTSVFPQIGEREAFTEYLTLGGMPYLAKLRFEAAPSQLYLQDLYNSVMLKDIVKRNKVRDVDLLERIIAYTLRAIGTTFSAASISKYFKSENRVVAPETIMNYLSFCRDAFILHQACRQDLQGKKILKINEKYYVADHGIREAVFGSNMRDIGMIVENIVFMELLRRGYRVTVGKAGAQEIDFIGDKRNDRIYVQVAYLLASPETVQREFDVYRAVRDNFPKYVLSLDEFDFSRDGIIHMNVRDFLMRTAG
jgi:predicted AAA+ superfamily ATPase